MLPYIHVIVPLYAVFTALGFAAAFAFFCHRTRDLSLGTLKKIQILIAVALGMLIGSRVIFVLTVLPNIIAEFSVDKLIAVVINGGFVFYGGLLGTLLALYIYGKARRLDPDKLFKAITPCFPLFHAFGRIGCFMSGCCYGIPCSFGFAMAHDPSVIRFPVQLAESLCCVIIFLALLFVERRSPKTGLLNVYLISYSAARFCLEFLRGDTVRGIWLCFSTSQWIALIIIAVCIVRIIASKRKRASSIA